MSDIDAGGRTCPFCTKTMPLDAVLCQSCGKFSNPRVLAGPSVTIIDRCNQAVASWEENHRHTIDRLIDKTRRPVNFAPAPRIAAASVLFVVGSVFIAVWLGEFGGFVTGRAAIACIVIGMALIIGPRLLNDAKDQKALRVANAPWIVAFGFASNLAVAQLLALLTMIVFAYRGEIDPAWWTGIVVVGLSALLFKSRARIATSVMGSIGLLFSVCLWAMSDIGFVIAADQRSRAIPDLIVPIGSLAWAIMVLAVVPQLQLFRIGSFGIGRFKGDFVTRLFGSDVPVSVTTAILLVSLEGVVNAILYLPDWTAIAIGN